MPLALRTKRFLKAGNFFLVISTGFICFDLAMIGLTTLSLIGGFSIYSGALNDLDIHMGTMGFCASKGIFLPSMLPLNAVFIYLLYIVEFWIEVAAFCTLGVVGRRDIGSLSLFLVSTDCLNENSFCELIV